MGEGVLAVRLRSGAPLPDEEESELIALPSPFALGHRWPLGVPAQDRENGHGLRDPSENYGLSSFIHIRKLQNKKLGLGPPYPGLVCIAPS